MKKQILIAAGDATVRPLPSQERCGRELSKIVWIPSPATLLTAAVVRQLPEPSNPLAVDIDVYELTVIAWPAAHATARSFQPAASMARILPPTRSSSVAVS